MFDEFLPPVVAELMLNSSQFTAGLGKAEAQMSTTGTKLLSISKATAAGFAVMGAAVAAYSVKMASDFDAAMERVHTQAGATQKEVDSLKKSVLTLAPKVGEGPTQLADALYHLESAGFRGAQAMDMLKYAAEGARIGNANLEDVTQAMVGVIASGIPGVKNAADAMAILNTTVGIGDMRMEQLAKAMATGILPSARSAGLSMNDVSAALATLTDNVTPADEVATRLRMTFSLMAAPTKAATKALEGIGLGQYSLARDMRKPDGLLLAVEDLKSHLDKLHDPVLAENALARAFGGGRTSGSIITLIEELDRLKSKYGDIGTSSSRAAAFQDAWAKTQQQFSQQMAELRATVETLAVRIGEWLIPKLQHLGVDLMHGIDWLKKHKDAAHLLEVALGVGLVVALTAATAGMVAFTVSLVTNPVFLMLAAIEALGVGVYELWTHWDQIWNWISHHKGIAITAAALATIVFPLLAIPITLAVVQHAWHIGWSDIATFFLKIADGVLVGFKAVVDGMFSMVEGILSAGSHLPFVGKYFARAKNDVEDMRRGFDSSLQGAISSIHDFENNLNKIPPVKRVTFTSDGVPNVVADIARVNTALDKIGSSYVVSVGGTGRKLITGQTGMRVPGGYGGGDIVPALLEPGEAVVPKHLVGPIAPFLSAHGVPGFAGGGLVGPTIVQVDTMGIGNSLFSGYGGMLSGASGGSSGAMSSGSAVSLGRIMAATYGWTGAQFDALNKLWTRESGWNPYAVNPSSGAYGIPQSLGHGHPYNLGDAGAQIAWGLQYIAGRYGSPLAAWAHEMAAGWYHGGGMVPGSGNVPIVAQGGEGVINRAGMSALAAINHGRVGVTYNVTINTLDPVSMRHALSQPGAATVVFDQLDRHVQRTPASARPAWTS
jgi:TP901 family phage tail tape measure protein